MYDIDLRRTNMIVLGKEKDSENTLFYKDMLRYIRKNANVSQTSLAKSVGMSQQVLSKYETLGNLSFKNAFAILDKLGLTFAIVPKDVAPSQTDKEMSIEKAFNLAMVSEKSLKERR